MADPIIKLGSTGDAVKKAQKALIERFYLNVGTDDGIFGHVTDFARKVPNMMVPSGQFNAFTFPLTIDGIVGPQTWHRLTPTRRVQERLKGQLREAPPGDTSNPSQTPQFDPGPVDGDFGANTATAVKAFRVCG